MKNLILILTVSLLAFSCNSKIDGENAATAKKEFKATDFKNLDVNCNCDVTVIPSEISKVVVESHQNLIDNLEIVSNEKNLKIKEKKPVGEYDLYNVNIYTNPGLSEIELSKQTKMKISGTLKSEKLKIEAKDQSFVNQAYLDIQDLELDFSDQSNVNLSGTAINLNLDIADESIADLSNLQTVKTEFNAEGNAMTTLHALKDLTGKAIDNSKIFYLGDPDKDTAEKDKATITKK
jgi:hypothetical protein